MKKILLILSCLILSATALLADNTYPYSYTVHEQHQGGKLFITRPQGENTPYSFFVKPSWAEESEIVYVWKGFTRKDARGSSIGGSYLLAAYALENSVLMLRREKDKLFLNLVDTNLNTVTTTELYGEWDEYSPINAAWLDEKDDKLFLLLINDVLFKCVITKDGYIQTSQIARQVKSAVLLEASSKAKNQPYAYLISREGSGLVFFVDENGAEHASARLALPDDVYIYPLGKLLAVVSTSESFSNSLLHIIDIDEGVVSAAWVESQGRKIKFQLEQQKDIVYFLRNTGAGYSFVITEYKNLNYPATWLTTELPEDLIEPLGLWLKEQGAFVLFRNGIASFDYSGKLISLDYFPIGEIFRDLPELIIRDKFLVLSSNTASVIMEQNEHTFWILTRFIQESGRFVFPMILIILFIIVFQMYRTQKRLLQAVLNLPSSGAVFVMDKNGCLDKANASGKQLLGITESIPLRKPFQYYCTLEHTKPIKEMIEKSLTVRDSITQKINVMINNEPKEYYCTVIPLRSITGRFRGMVFTGIDITEELERKRLSNWAQLAHDMQTNLSTIRLNAEQLDVEDNEGNLGRRKKILHQVGLLIQRVRDVVTVGRSESLNKEIVDAAEICHTVRMEFDEAVFPQVEFFVEPKSFNVSCDKLKFERALRNAVENGIRAMGGKPGSITISNSYDSRFAYFSVKDTGAGMDEKAKAKMLTPYFTTAKKHGGTGMGTMIMQHVVEQHGGDIIVNSEKGKGTEVIFRIPNFAYNRPSKDDRPSKDRKES